MKIKHLKDRISYKLYNKENDLLSDECETICFSLITYNLVDKNIDKIVIYSIDEHTAFEEEDCRKWTSLLNEFGFEVSYLGFGTKEYKTEENEHVWVIPLTNKNSKRTYLHSTLILIRYLIEDKLYTIINEFWRLVSEYNIKTLEEKFQLMQFCHRFNAGSVGHSLRSDNKQTTISMEEFHRRAELGANIYESSKSNTHKLWEGRETMKKDFKFTMDKEYINIYVVGGNTCYTNWIPLKHKFVDNLEEADLAVFTGGEDVSPSIYDAPTGSHTRCNPFRDKKEVPIFKKVQELKLRSVNVCRGAQLACALSGGKLVQHQQNPNYIDTLETEKYGKVKITSSHHQAMYPFNLKPWKYKIIGWTNNNSKFHLDGNNEEMNPPKECEIVWFRDTKALCIQGHPEYTDYQKAYPEDLKIIQNIFLDFWNDQL